VQPRQRLNGVTVQSRYAEVLGGGRAWQPLSLATFELGNLWAWRRLAHALGDMRAWRGLATYGLSET